MAGNKYLNLNGGDIQQYESVNSSAGAGDANKVVSLNASGKIDETMLNDTPSAVMTASEDLAAGDFVNIWNDAGTEKIRKATNTGIGTKAHGYVESAILEDADGVVTLGEGVLAGFTGLTRGATYFLGTSGGKVLAGALPSSTSNIVQELGVAKSETEIAVNIMKPVILA